MRWNGSSLTNAGVPTMLRQVQVFALHADRAGNLWIGTKDGLIRVDAKGNTSRDEEGAAARRAVTAVFEDGEGDIWVGRNGSLERLRAGPFIALGRSHGLPSDQVGPVYIDKERRTWAGPIRGGLYWLSDNASGKITVAGLDSDVVYSITGHDNELWIGRRRGGLTRLRTSGGAFDADSWTEKDGLAQNSVFTVNRNRDGTIWAGTLNGGVSRLRDGAITNFTTANGLASNSIASIIETSDGTTWLATPGGLHAWSHDRWRVYRLAEGLPSDEVNCLHEDSSGSLWIGSSGGLAVYSSGRVQGVGHLLPALRERIVGVSEDRTGSLWVATANRVLQLNAEGLRRGIVAESGVREYDLEDGLPSIEPTRRDRAVLQDPNGRIWISTAGGLSVIDPAEVARRSPPAVSRIEGMSADGSPVDLKGPIRVASGSERITFTFAGLSLAAPHSVKFRYRLYGLDRSWSAPVNALEPMYSNLSHGH